MKTKSAIAFLTYSLLLLLSPTVLAAPCPPPDCGDCYTWNSETEECEWDCTTGQCCDDGVCVDNCDDCYTCESGSCEWDCTTGQCCDDGTCVSSCPSGECCSGGTCVSSCPSGECCDDGTCVSTCPSGVCCDGTCCEACCDDIICYDPSTQICCWDEWGTLCNKNTECCYHDPNGPWYDPDICIDDCIPLSGEMCSYELPYHKDQDECKTQPGNWLCDPPPPGTDCGYKVTDGPYKNAICFCSCDLDSTWCVKYREAECQNAWIWYPPFFMCQCLPYLSGGFEMQSGSRNVCP